jgi:hypothetical protein
VSRIAGRLENEVRRLEAKSPYLLVGACYLKVRRGERARDLALLVVGLSASLRSIGKWECEEAYRNLLRGGLLERGLRGVGLATA